MLTSILGLRSPLANIINPNFLTLALLPSDTNKSPSSQPPSSSPSPTTAQDEDPSPKALATISLLSGTLGLAAMSAVQSLTGYILLLSLFGRAGARTYMKEFLRADVSALTPEQLARRALMARDPRYASLFLPLMASLSIALPEEVLKYLPVVWLARRKGKGKDGGDQVRAATAAALGFGVVELVAYVHAAAASTTTGPPMAVTLLERVFVGLPGHVAMAVLSASRGADAGADAGGGSGGWRAVLSAVAPSVAYHALFDLILLGSSALVGGHVGWVHPEGLRAVVGTLGACAVVQGVLYVHTARAWLGWGEKARGE
ncbi:hypothetical protein F5883DRAFT_114123 [Diaporthe sp. PMI_573]|nr:hypothetical protein F5883DRAFT_114123 [Diaporthaceae sp. PMI_573]